MPPSRSAPLWLIFASLLGALVLAAPAGSVPGPTATATPNSGLVDQQRIVIRGSGFDPNTPIQVIECNGTLRAPPLNTRVCEGTTLDSSGYTDNHGNYVNTPGDKVGTTQGYLILTLPDPISGLVSIGCGHGHDPQCLLYVGEDHNNFPRKHVFVPISFKGQNDSGSSGASWLVALGIALAVGFAGLVFWRRRVAATKARRPNLSRR